MHLEVKYDFFYDCTLLSLDTTTHTNSVEFFPIYLLLFYSSRVYYTYNCYITTLGQSKYIYYASD